MYYVEFKRIKFLTIFIILLFSISVLNLNVKAEEELILLPDEEQSASDYNDEDRVDVFSPKIKRRSNIVERKIRSRNDSALQDKVFVSGNNNPTFNRLLTTVFLVIFALFSFLVLTKLFLARNQFSKPGGLLDELAQKFTGNFSSANGLKLIQTLILTPGQSLYLIEIDGKRILVGGTQQGGVQFVSDLSQGSQNSEKLDFKRIEDYKISSNNTLETMSVNGTNNRIKENIKQPEVQTNPFTPQEATLEDNLPDEVRQNVVNNNLINRQTFKRRASFRKSLLNERGSSAEELLRAKNS